MFELLTNAFAGKRPSRLPVAAAEKLTILRQQKDDAYALLRNVTDKINELREELMSSESRLKYLLMPMSASGGGAPEDHHDVVRHQRRIAELRAEIQRLEPIRKSRGEAWQAIATLVQRLDDYVSSLAREAKVSVVMPDRSTRRKASIAELEATRASVNTAKAELIRVREAPIPAQDAKALATAQINALADQGRADVEPLFHGGDIRWPELWRIERVTGGEGVVTVPCKFEAVVAALFQDQVIAAVHQQIDDTADEPKALTNDQRRQLETQLVSSLLDAERAEERLVEHVEREGIPVVRRAEADPRAVLGLSGDLPAP